MRLWPWMTLLCLAACVDADRPSATSTGSATLATAGTGASRSDSRATCTHKAAVEHRASAVACDPNRKREPGNIIAGAPQGLARCLSDAECTAGMNGRCSRFFGYQACTYDECFADSDCPDGSLCACDGGTQGTNACVAGNCLIDSDCGPGAYCSPSYSICGRARGAHGYYCHTCQDTCTNVSECPLQAGPYNSCEYIPTDNTWGCSSGFCDG